MTCDFAWVQTDQVACTQDEMKNLRSKTKEHCRYSVECVNAKHL